MGRFPHVRGGVMYEGQNINKDVEKELFLPPSPLIKKKLTDP